MQLVKDIAMPLLVAFVALCGTYIGSSISAAVARDGQQAQLAEDRSKAERDRRSEIYMRFLGSADAYYRRQVEAEKSCRNSLAASTPEERTGKILLCVGRDPQLATLLEPLRKARDELQVYGSSDAVAASEEVMIFLPIAQSALGTSEVLVFMNFDGQLEKQIGGRTIELLGSWSNFSSAYREFQRVACRDLPPRPRENC